MDVDEAQGAFVVLLQHIVCSTPALPRSTTSRPGGGPEEGDRPAGHRQRHERSSTGKYSHKQPRLYRLEKVYQ